MIIGTNARGSCGRYVPNCGLFHVSREVRGTRVEGRNELNVIGREFAGLYCELENALLACRCAIRRGVNPLLIAFPTVLDEASDDMVRE